MLRVRFHGLASVVLPVMASPLAVAATTLRWIVRGNPRDKPSLIVTACLAGIYSFALAIVFSLKKILFFSFGAIVMRRCLYLVEAGYITADQALHAVRHQLAMRRPIGQMAVECRMMSMNQVFVVLQDQLDCDQPFGQLAIQRGYLTEEDLGTLILKQLDSVPRLKDILIEAGAVSAEVIRQAEIRYEALPKFGQSQQNLSAAE